jgi:hypothetical protein
MSDEILVELPPEHRAKFAKLLEECRLAWEEKRDPGAIVDALWWIDNFQQPRPPWLEEAARKFPVDMGRVAASHVPSSTGPRGKPKQRWGSLQFALYAIQSIRPTLSRHLSRSKLVDDVQDFLKRDSTFRATGLKLPKRDTINRALDRLLLLYSSD